PHERESSCDAWWGRGRSAHTAGGASLRSASRSEPPRRARRALDTDTSVERAPRQKHAWGASLRSALRSEPPRRARRALATDTSVERAPRQKHAWRASLR